MWTVISDKQKGLIKAIEYLLPNAEHRFCIRHMYNNFRQKFRGLQLKDLLWRAASATSIIDFNVEMEKLKTCDKKAYDWVRERNERHWARPHFSVWSKCDLLLNNFCESFNKVNLKAREKPIISMLETIRVILMKRLHTQRDNVLKFSGEVCPSIQRIVENNKKNSHNYILVWNDHNKFEVQG
ncbi:hypothetical protein KSP39_PZI011307 [Platanthera zijinensis]|uniref:MULE transposase domain-containing protein n=1 Tax=Platanthera zijinensis TaxID=2320716 RepID=A0AAP0G5Y2_9ASPA